MASKRQRTKTDPFLVKKQTEAKKTKQGSKKAAAAISKFSATVFSVDLSSELHRVRNVNSKASGKKSAKAKEIAARKSNNNSQH